MMLWGGGYYGGGRRVLGDDVVGGGCWGMLLWEEGVMGDGVVVGGCWGDSVVGGRCWGGGDGIMDNTSEPTNIFRSDFWGFSPLPSLSNRLFLLSQLNVHVHVYLSLLSLSSL